MVDKETFLSMNHKDFKWPYSKPLTAKPVQPPVQTKSKNFFVKGPVDAYCHCDGHLYDPMMNQYLKLAQKERLLVEELTQLNQEMAGVESDILDHECDTYDDKLESTYQIDYTKRDLPLTQYVKLMPDVDSPAGNPKKSPTIGLGNGYRDPTRFRYSTFQRPTIDPCGAVSFNVVPSNIDLWFAAQTGRSEYQDALSKVGWSIIKSRQQYAEPLPSSRRRYAEMNL